MTSPAKRMRLSSQRQSISGNRQSVVVSTPSQSALRTSINASSRANANETGTYDIITNQPTESISTQPRRPSFTQSANIHPLRKSNSRQSMIPQPERPVATVSQSKYQEDTLALQTRINKLEYELRTFESERGLLTLQHEKELREAEARAEADYKKFSDSEAERAKAVRQQEAALNEVRAARDRSVNDNAASEQRARKLQKQCEQLQEEKYELEAQLNDAEREVRRIQVEEVESARNRLERLVEETNAELDEMKTRFENVNTKLHKKEQYAEELEQRVLNLNSRTGGGEELEVLKREFSEQMTNVRRLENTEREQRAKLRKLEDERRSVNVVLEEKRALEVQIQVLKESERRAGELELQKEILEDEKRTWTSLLENPGEEDEREFESPEAVVRALVNERIEHALILDRLGTAESDAATRDESIRALESERASLKAELESLKEQTQESSQSIPAEPEIKVVKRMDRQNQLAKKEIEYLQAQLETFNTEETTMMENAGFDAQRAEQITRLQALVSEYRSEIEVLHNQMKQIESNQSIVPAPTVGQKRKSEEPESEQLGHILRKNKNLQAALQKVTQQSQMLAKDLQATKSQLKALRESAQTRVLELRDNPTARHEAIKAETLRTLKQENADLMSQLRGDSEAISKTRVVPVSSLDAIKLDLQAKDIVIADRDKSMRRQREIWTMKAAEFRDVIASILGYNMTFLPNGKVKVRSMYYNPPKDGQASDEDIAEEDREDYIEFDGDKGTMKLGGGRDSHFGQDVSETVNYWVNQKREIPCFLAAMTLEFYEKYGGLNGEPTS